MVSTTSTTNEYGVWDIWETTEADEVRGNIERKKTYETLIEKYRQQSD